MVERDFGVDGGCGTTVAFTGLVDGDFEEVVVGNLSSISLVAYTVVAEGDFGVSGGDGTAVSFTGLTEGETKLDEIYYTECIL